MKTLKELKQDYLDARVDYRAADDAYSRLADIVYDAGERVDDAYKLWLAAHGLWAAALTKEKKDD